MLSALDQFDENVKRVKVLSGLTHSIMKMTAPVVDASDILRAQYVFAVGALDLYVHELTRLGMLEIFDGLRSAPPAYLRYRISMDCVVSGVAVSRGQLDTQIRIQHGFLSFQHPDKIADAIRLVKDVKLWDRVGVRLNEIPADVKERLALIVDRRNKIAHEADIDPTYPKALWPISATDVDGVVAFLDGVVRAIHAEVV